MKTRKNSIIAILLTFVMAVTMIPAIAFADEEPSSEIQQETATEQESEPQQDPVVEETAEPEPELAMPSVTTENQELSPKGENWTILQVDATLEEANGTGGVATYTVTVKNTSSKKLTLSWMYSWIHDCPDYDGYPFGTYYYGGSKVANDGKGVTLTGGQTKTFTVKGTIPKTWINGKSYVIFNVGIESLEYYGQCERMYSYFENASSYTTTGFRKYKNMAAYVSQPSLGKYTLIGSMIRTYMNDNQSRAIPGLANTYIGKNVKTYVPQGLCSFTYNGKQYYLITAYDSKGKNNGVIYALDSNWKYIKTITFPHKYHNGGIAYDPAGQVVWFTGDTSQNRPYNSVFCMKGSTLYSLITKKGEYASINTFDKMWKINNNASCLEYSKGRLWVGTFGDVSGKIIGYKTSGTTLYRNDTYSIPGVGGQLNGFTFGNNMDIYFSYSHGRSFFGTSRIDHAEYTYAGNNLVLKPNTYRSVLVPKMNEEILLKGNYLYVLYESAATKYISDAYIVTDRITAINKAVWANSKSIKNLGEEAAPEEILIHQNESKEIEFDYDAANEINNSEKILSFTPEESGTYNISIELPESEQDYYVTGGVADTEPAANDMLLSEFSTVENVYEEEDVISNYLNNASVEINLTAGHKYNLSLFASVAGEAESYAGTYTVVISRIGDIDTTVVGEGTQTEKTVSAGNSSCFEIVPEETGTYLIDWQSEGELAGNMITDSAGNQIELKDNYCELTGGETYYFSSNVLEGEGTSETASVHFAYEKMEESQLQPDQEVSVTANTMMTYHADTAGRHIVKFSSESEEVTITAYDSEGNVVGLGGTSMILNTEADTDYRISCTGADESAVISVEPYIANINTTKVTLTKELKYSKRLKAPVPKLTEDQNTLVRNTDYTVKYDGISAKGTPPAKARNVGKHKVTITGIGKYKGTVNYYYTIKPASTSVSKLKAYKKAAKVYWKKQSLKMASTRITGYQVQVATNKSFTANKKSKMVKGYGKTSYKFTKLKAKKTYYARVRTYKTVNGTKYYSSWSTVKKIKTK